MTDRAAWGWCPSVLRPMPLDDGLMVRIRLWMDRMTSEQALGLADLAERYGAGVIELTNRANLQLRGLTEVEHADLLPRLKALGLARVDETASGRVNVTLTPFRAERDIALAQMLSERLSETHFKRLPEKFGFVIETGLTRVLADTPGDIRIEGSGTDMVVRPAGCATGRRAETAIAACDIALGLADWFVDSGGISPDGRGRMAELSARIAPPPHLTGEADPNPTNPVDTVGTEWVASPDGKMLPARLREAAQIGREIRVTPFRALYLPHLAPKSSAWNTSASNATA